MIVVTTYLGHRVEMSDADIVVYTPWGIFLGSYETMSSARLAVRRARRAERLAA